ncbi:MAG: hypothetical protein MZV65_12815 [Chromatiales bacterium]|nr:hypothetical protein [Chromatiales bacterium]
MTDKLTSWRAVWLAMRSWRTAAVSLLSFSSGLPLGLVWIAIPVWLARLDVDIRIIGLFTLAQAPWSFKFLWSPFMDRYAPAVLRPGRSAGGSLFWQVALAARPRCCSAAWRRTPRPSGSIGALDAGDRARVRQRRTSPSTPMPSKCCTATSRASRSARAPRLYRAAMFLSGGAAITAGRPVVVAGGVRCCSAPALPAADARDRADGAASPTLHRAHPPARLARRGAGTVRRAF